MRKSPRPTMWEIAARLDSGDVAIATHYLLGLHPADQANLLAKLSPEERRLLRADLALASEIFVTTVTDVMGFFMFLSLASLPIDKIA